MRRPPRCRWPQNHLPQQKLNSNEVRGPGLKHLAGLKKLRELALAGERIDDDTLKFVAGLPDLECLELGLCKVTGRGLGALGNLKNLKSLNLAVSATGGITEEGLARAAQLQGPGANRRHHRGHR